MARPLSVPLPDTPERVIMQCSIGIDMKLLLPFKGLNEVVEVSEDLSGEVSLQAANDLSSSRRNERAEDCVDARDP